MQVDPTTHPHPSSWIPPSALQFQYNAAPGGTVPPLHARAWANSPSAPASFASRSWYFVPVVTQDGRQHVMLRRHPLLPCPARGGGSRSRCASPLILQHLEQLRVVLAEQRGPRDIRSYRELDNIGISQFMQMDAQIISMLGKLCRFWMNYPPFA